MHHRTCFDPFRRVFGRPAHLRLIRVLTDRGSLEGMAGGVDAVLRELLGDEAVQQLIEEGRYRRDVY